MRSFAVGISWLLSLVVLFPALLAGQKASADEPLTAARTLLRNGDFHGASAGFQRIIADHPSAEAYAGLIQSLLKADDVKSADEQSLRALAAFANSALAHASRGDVLFRRGMLPEAGDEYRNALNLEPDCPRALLGAGKIEEAQSLRQPAREHVSRAHELDPEDGDALYEWAIRQSYPANVDALEQHLSAFHSDPDFERHEREYMELLKALAGRKVWILSPAIQNSEIKLEPLTLGPGLARRGMGVRVTFNDRASATLLLDTGASGVTITRKFADKIGAQKLSDQVLQGIGKRGLPGYTAWVDGVTVGDIHFHNCFVHVVPQTVADIDGLIGTDVFVDFLLTLDFPARKVRLDAQAAVPSSQANSGASAPAYSFGHILLLPARAGGSASGLFVLDSGSNLNTISNELSRQLKEMRSLNAPVSGVGGASNSAFISEALSLEFAGARERDQRLITIDLHSVSKNLGTEVSGQIGFAALENSRLTIDYRRGFVKLEQKSK